MNSIFKLRSPGRRTTSSSLPDFQVVKLVLALVFLGLPTLDASAHDPYEITSTVRIESNRTAVEVEMEFSAAMALIGASPSREASQEAALFQSHLPELRHAAGGFLEIGGAGGPLAATRTNVTLGVENHVRFELEYPAPGRGLKVAATGLKPLAERGAFGVGLTVLDMVNMKVLGQATLFVHSPVAEFAPAGLPAMAVATVAPPTNSGTSSAVPPAPSSPAAPKPAPAGDLLWVFVVLMVFGAVLLVLFRRWRAERG